MILNDVYHLDNCKRNVTHVRFLVTQTPYCATDQYFIGEPYVRKHPVQPTGFTAVISRNVYGHPFTHIRKMENVIALLLYDLASTVKVYERICVI